MTTDAKLAAVFLQKHPEVAARVLETMELGLAAEVLDSTPSPVAATVVNRMLLSSSAELARQLSAQSVASLLDHLPVLTGAALLRQLPEAARDDLLRRIKRGRMTALRLLLRYPEGAVGACMTPGVLTLSSDYSIREAADCLERAEHAAPRIFVVNRDRKPRGAVRVISVLRGPQEEKLSSITEPVESIWARESVLAAQTRDLWEHEAEAPVVNRSGEFLGTVSFTDLVKGQRGSGRTKRADDSDESLGELAELLWHGLGSAWSGVAELARSQAAGARGGRQERDA